MSFESRAYVDSMWFMEFLVLVLIAYEVGHAAWQGKKSKRLHDELFDLMSKGNALHWAKPNEHTNDPYTPEALSWEKQVKDWIRSTAIFLEKKSPKAAKWFLQEIDESYYQIERNIHFWDTALYERGRNLRELMEQSDRFF